MRNIVLNQIYVNMGAVNAAEYTTIAGLIGMAVESVVLTYNEVACVVNVSCENPSKLYTNYEWVEPSGEVPVCSVVGTNSYFNFKGNVAADFGGLGKYAGVFDVARKLYYSDFSDNQWLVFSTDKHPTLREFMAVGDFATVQNVEEKLIELGYTKIM